MDGLLLVDKPAGWTSFDVVNYVRRMVQHSEYNTTGKKRYPVGHTGTLDPLATGLLVLALGTYTKRAQELTKLDKIYQVTMRLGQASTTGDAEGDITAVSDVRPDEAAVQAALQAFTGPLMQTPPQYSAMKVNGVRAYQLARQGKAVQLEPRPVTVYETAFVSYTYPDVHFISSVSSGTYIRSLVEDIGARLGTGAYMAGLRRTQVGQFQLARALPVQPLTPGQIAAAILRLPTPA